MRIALVKPTSRGFSLKGAKQVPSGIISLASILLSEGLECEIFDGSFYDVNSDGTNNEENLRNRARALDALINDVARYSPDILGVSAYTDTMPECEMILSRLSKTDGIPLKIAGGPHATARPAEILKHCDAVFTGESESAFQELARLLKHNERSIIDSLSRTMGAVTKSNLNHHQPEIPLTNLDAIGYLGWNTVSKYLGMATPSSYRHISNNFINLMTSRGCQNICSHCASPITHGQKIRKHSLVYIKGLIEHIGALHEKRGLPPLDSIKFDDDDLLARTTSELEELGKYLWHKGISYTCSASISNASNEKLEILGSTGGKSIFFGIETHESRRKSIMTGPKGTMTDHQIVQALEAANKAGLFTITGYVIGYPDETVDDIAKTIQTMHMMPSDYPILLLLEIYPGTGSWQWMDKRREYFPNLPLPDEPFIDRDRWDTKPAGLPHSHRYLSRKDLIRLKKDANVIAYSSQERLQKALQKCHDKNETDAVRKNFEHFRE